MLFSISHVSNLLLVSSLDYHQFLYIDVDIIAFSIKFSNEQIWRPLETRKSLRIAKSRPVWGDL